MRTGFRRYSAAVPQDEHLSGALQVREGASVILSRWASHAPSPHLPCEPVELEGLQLVELLVQDPAAAPSVSVGFCAAG